MSYNVERLSGPHHLGEGPHWDDERQALFYVDAFKSKVCRYTPQDNKYTWCQVDPSGCVSIIIPVTGKPDKFLVTIAADVAELTWDGESTTPQNVRVLTSVKNGPGQKGTRFNDGKVDPFGRIWIGTMGDMDENMQFPPGVGSLYSFTKDMTIKKHLDGLTVANGLAWSPDGKTMYYIDTPTKRVDGFDYNPESGDISNRRTIYDFSNDARSSDGGGPDGMTIDTDGNLWVAVFGASGVYNINPRSGELIRIIDIPSPQTTSVAFGGPNNDELYVVSANILPEEEAKLHPDAGYTFRVTGLGVRGAPMDKADIAV